MLREYRLTNFKAFGETVTIPIRPLTLIFGANSSGKSSIFQSLLMLKQTLEEAKSQDTALLPKGSLVDLGTYADFVHRHETGRNFEFEARFEAPLTYKTDKIQCPEAGLSVRFAYSREKDCLDVSSGNLDIISDTGEKQPIASYTNAVEFDESGKLDHRLAEFDLWPRTYPGWPEPASRSDWEFWESWQNVLEDCYTEKDSESLARLIYLNFFWELPELSSDVGLQSELRSSAMEVAEKSIKEFVSEEKDFDSYMTGSDRTIGASGYENFLPCDFGPVEYSDLSGRPWEWMNLPVERVLSKFRANLEDLVYLGPLRRQPERHYEFSGDTTEYVGQSGGYLPSLLFEDQELVEQLNSDLERLGVKYQVKLDKLQYEDESPSNVFSLRLVDKDKIDVSIRDVGFGISQVLPIVVQSRLSEKKTLLVEQPEIHLHPAHQAELGDLFIRSALEQKNTLLLETHSEHLLLRIMRRMRETSTGKLPEGAIAVRPEDVVVLFVESDGSQSIVREMPLDERGELVKAWPGGFFEEGLREVL